MERVLLRLVNQLILGVLSIGSNMGQEINIFQMEMSIEESIKTVDSMEWAPMNGKQIILYTKEILKMV